MGNQGKINRILVAKKETITLLNKALKYLPEFQMLDQIEFYKNHIKKLDEMLTKEG